MMKLSRERINMLPTREKVDILLQEAEMCNPGSWGKHSRVATYCDEKIAAACGDMDPDGYMRLGKKYYFSRK